MTKDDIEDTVESTPVIPIPTVHSLSQKKFCPHNPPCSDDEEEELMNEYYKQEEDDE